jgi:lipoprotein-releasing system permease protein
MILTGKLIGKYMLRRPIVWLAIVTIAVSVFIQLVVMTIMDGLIRDFADKNHALVGDCVITSSSLTGFPYYAELINELEANSQITAAAPVIHASALLSMDDGDWTQAIDLIGIKPESYCAVTGFCDSLYKKSYSGSVFEHPHGQGPGCIRGISMMNAKSGSGTYNHSLDYPIKLEISGFPLTWKGTLANEATGLINSQTFYVANDSDTGVPLVDDFTVYVPFEQAEKICGMDTSVARVNRIFIKFERDILLDDGVNTVRGIFERFVGGHADSQFAELFEQVQVKSWKVHLVENIAPMEKERTMLTALFTLLGLLNVFVVFIVFYIIVNSKHKDIGILRSFGVSRLSLMVMFTSFSAAIGITGASLGWLGGWAFLRYINELENWLFTNYGWQLWDRSIYAIGLIPNQLNTNVLFWIIFGALTASILGCLGPAHQAVKQNPVNVLRVGTV